MIDAGPSLQAAVQLPLAALAKYLEATGWKSEPSRISGITIHAKVLPEATEPVRIVLPEVPELDDEQRRIADALRTLQAVEERPIERIADEVRQTWTKKDSQSKSGSDLPRPNRSEQTLQSYAGAGLEGLSPQFAPKLKQVGIRTTEKLLEAAKSLRGRRMLAEKTEIEEHALLRVAHLIDRMRIKGVGREYAGLLEAVGVVTIKELRFRNPTRLAKALAEANAKKRLVRALPSEQTVERWIEHAKKLPVKITY